MLRVPGAQELYMKRHWGVYVVSFMNITNTTQCPSSAFLFLALGAGLPVALASCPEQPHTLGSKRVGCQAGGLVQTCWACVTLAFHTVLSHRRPHSAVAKALTSGFWCFLGTWEMPWPGKAVIRG